MCRCCAEWLRAGLALLLWVWMLPSQAGMALWMWEEDAYALLESPSRAQDAIAFMRRQDIDTVYLYADAHDGRNLLVQQPALYGRLIAQLHRQGIQVHALLGSWPLHTERYILPEQRPQALAMVQRVLDYNQAATTAERFDGINLDIEPHVLDDWSARREEYLQLFVQLSEAWMALKRQAQPSLQIGPAIAFWLDGIPIWHRGQRKPASEHLQDIYDHVVLMDYRDHAHGPDGILSHARDELDYGRKIGKRVLLGVETSPNEIRKLSFHHKTPAQMAHELGLVRQALADEPAFGGFVVHHYGSYRRWLGQ
ncbi:MAG: hypothetical protein RL559_497 [Pseudomonadota bacterium]